MIIQKGLVTDVEFSKTKENGIVSVGVDPKTSLLLQPLTGFRTVGMSLENDLNMIEDLPAVRLNFYNKESVDVVIAALEHIKKNIENPYNQYTSAC
jgi:hypothetical protein